MLKSDKHLELQNLQYFLSFPACSCREYAYRINLSCFRFRHAGPAPVDILFHPGIVADADTDQPAVLSVSYRIATFEGM